MKEILNTDSVLLVWIKLLQRGAGRVIPNLLPPKIKRQPDFYLAVPTFEGEYYFPLFRHSKDDPPARYILAEVSKHCSGAAVKRPEATALGA